MSDQKRPGPAGQQHPSAAIAAVATHENPNPEGFAMRNEPRGKMAIGARPRWWSALAAAIGAALIVGGMSLGVMPAAAAGYGPGYDNGAGHLGAYSVGGVNVYCLQESAARPTGATDGGSLQGWGGMGPDALAQLDYVFKAYGQSGSANVTAGASSGITRKL